MSIVFDPFSGPELTAVIPLTEAQKEIWISTVIDGNASLCYNLSFSLNLKGSIDTSLLAESISELVKRHESLRLTLSADGSGACIYSDVVIEIPLLDAPEYNCEAWEKLVSEKTDLIFDLVNGPLFRSYIFRHNPEDHTLLIVLHHIICDGWSMDVLLHDLSQIYSDKLSSKEISLDLPFQYSDYVKHLLVQKNSEEISMKYWKELFFGNVPVLDLPVDFIRPEVRTYSAARISRNLDKNILTDIKKLAAGIQGSFFSVFLAAWAIQIFNLTDQNDIVIGVPFAGQLDSGMDNLVGHCVSLLPVLIKIDENISFAELAKNTRTVVFDAYENQHVTFGSIIQNIQIKRDPSRIPLISVCFTHTQKYNENRLLFGDCEVDYFLPPRNAETFEIHLEALESVNGIDLLCQYNTSLFSSVTIHRYLEEIETVIRRVIENPEIGIKELKRINQGVLHSDDNNVLSKEEENKLIEKWNNTGRDYDLSICLHRLFEMQAEKTPGREALIFKDQSITYRELNEKSNRLARYLVSVGTGPDKIVGIYMERSIEMVVSLYAVLKAGGAYLPLSPDLPVTRIMFMADDAEPVIILTQPHLEKNLSDFQFRVLPVDPELSTISETDSSNINSSVSNGNLAYCIYTSGSTGKPKGVLITHKGICNRLHWMQEYFKITEDDCVLQKTPFDFDVSVWEFFWPLISGAVLVIAEPGGHRDSAYLMRTIKSERITVIHFVPTMLDIFLREPDLSGCTSLRYVICSGEVLTYSLQERFFEAVDCGLYNLYGPTEASVDVTCWRCCREYESKIVPIGFPVANTRMYILNENLQPVSVGVQGDLYIGGIQLARGYLKRDDLTESLFISDHFTSDAGARMYHTGDRARWLNDGAIEYLGRSDNQIKFHGLRIEPGEIEYAIEQFPAIAQTVVSSRGADEKMELVAYYTLKDGESCDTKNLRNFLKEILAQSLIPSIFFELQSFPTTASGKVDRKALPYPVMNETAKQSIPADLSKIEQQILTIWKHRLQVDNIGLDDNFFELGGHSLMLALVNNDVRLKTGIDVSMVEMFQYPTIASLAGYLGKNKRTESDMVNNSERKKKQMEALQKMKKKSGQG